MRRYTAILVLLAAISLSLVSPLLWAGTRKELPACCRRDGNHHCARQSGQPAESGVHIAAASTCPLFPTGKSAPASAQHGIAALALSTASASLTVHTTIMGAPTRTPFDSSFRAPQQRGPPSLHS
ncbi:MAG: hypothetical protein HYX27_22105 [Acidobacteria bacterium]|nr:hypothetical protein [Acidobacteriota bacterium]